MFSCHKGTERTCEPITSAVGKEQTAMYGPEPFPVQLFAHSAPNALGLLSPPNRYCEGLESLTTSDLTFKSHIDL